MPHYTRKGIWTLIKSSFTGFNDNNSFVLAAALAFNAIFSIPPLLVIIIRAAGVFFGEAAISGELSEQISRAIGPSAAVEVENIIQNAYTTEGAGIAFWIGIGTLIFASTTFFATLQLSLNTVWNLKPKPTNSILKMLQVRLFSFGIVLSIAFLMLMSLLLSAMISILSDFLTRFIPDIGVVLIRVFDILLSVGIITAFFALIYRFLPDAIIRWRDVWVGAFITSLLFGIGRFLISFYIGTSDPGSAYGAAGTMIVILIWIYYSSLIVLFGAELTQQYAAEYGQEIKPKEHAVFYTEQEVADNPRIKSESQFTGRPPADGRFDKKDKA